MSTIGFQIQDHKRQVSDGQGTDPHQQQIDVQPQGTDFQAQGTDLQPHETTLHPQGTDFQQHGKDLLSRETDLQPQGTDLQARGTEFQSQGMDYQSQGTDLPPQVLPPLEDPVIDPNDILLPPGVAMYKLHKVYAKGVHGDARRLISEKAARLEVNENGRICRTGRIIPTWKERQRIMEYAHGISHAGQLATFNLIASRYYWKNFTEDIRTFVDTCDVCKKNKSWYKRARHSQKLSTKVPGFRRGQSMSDRGLALSDRGQSMSEGDLELDLEDGGSQHSQQGGQWNLPIRQHVDPVSASNLEVASGTQGQQAVNLNGPRQGLTQGRGEGEGEGQTAEPEPEPEMYPEPEGTSWSVSHYVHDPIARKYFRHSLLCKNGKFSHRLVMFTEEEWQLLPYKPPAVREVQSEDWI